MEQYLRSYINNFQDNWVNLLLMAKFAGNFNISISIKIPLFLPSWSYLPQMSFEPVNLLANSTHKQFANTMARSIADQIQEVWEFTWKEMTKLQQTMVTVANKHQKKTLRYQVGNII